MVRSERRAFVNPSVGSGIRNYLRDNPLAAALMFGINLLAAFYLPWYIGLVVSCCNILIFQNSIYAMLIFFSLFEIKFYGYFSIYNLISVFYIVVFLIKLILGQKRIILCNDIYLYFVLIGIYLFGLFNFLYFFPYPIELFENILNGILNLIKVIIGFVLFLDLASATSEQLKAIFKVMLYCFGFGILALFIYFLTSATTFSIYSRYTIMGVNNNDFAGRLAVIAPVIMIALSLKEYRFRTKLLLLASLGLALYMILLTGSRTGLVCISLGLLLALCYSSLSLKQKFIAITSSAVLLYLALGYWGQDLMQRTLDSSSLSELSTGRLDIWIALLRSIANERIFFGYGVGRDTIKIISGIYGSYSAYDHNIFLAALISFGVVGLGIYAGFVTKPIWFMMRKRFLDQTYLIPFLMGFAAVISGMFLCWIFEETLLYSVSIALATANVLSRHQYTYQRGDCNQFGM
ncbi:MAG TPA: O-antigen ligase family protein [Bacillota bacterium]|nr:O-antigen ligase family protein [Bacillota bacterium]HOL08766.1 O-antigen ligase family protein [Bacillota bacterium]HPO96331.1 O-antigen ligase family protein [Bacillota bacterium]